MSNYSDFVSDSTTAAVHIADADKHREINDAGSGSTDLWSAQKINNEITILEATVTGTELWNDAGSYIYPDNFQNFRITDDGKLGIGKDPSTTLDVDGSAYIMGDVSIIGNMTVSGTTFSTQHETVEITDNLLLINNGEAGVGVTASGGIAGIEVDRGSLANYRFVFDETQDNFRVGEIGDLQAVATREDSPNTKGIPYWNATDNRFDTASTFVYDSGNIGIGTNDPSAKLTVYASSGTPTSLGVQGYGMTIGAITYTPNYGTLFGNNYYGDSSGNYAQLNADKPSWGLSFDSGAGDQAYIGRSPAGSTSLTPYLTIDNSGNVGIETTSSSYKLDVNGSIRCTSLTQTSDVRLKQNVATVNNALDRVADLRGVTFQWKDKAKGEGKQLGVIAQEVEEVFPEAVSTDNQGYKSVAYNDLVAVLIEAVKELKTENESLKSKIDDLERKWDLKD